MVLKFIVDGFLSVKPSFTIVTVEFNYASESGHELGNGSVRTGISGGS